MSRIFLSIAVVLAASSSAFGQSSGASLAELLRESSVRVDSIPVLAVQKSETAQSRTQAGAHQRVPETVSDRDETEGRFWGSAEYLLWKMKRSNLPPLITTGPASGNAIIGEPGTVIAFGGNKLDRGKFPGGRFTVGMWLNEKRNVGVDLSYFFLKERTVNFHVSSNGQPGSLTISRPLINHFNPSFYQETAIVIVSPRVLQETIQTQMESGSSTVISPSQMQGVEVNLVFPLRKTHCCQINLLSGFRYLLRFALGMALITTMFEPSCNIF